MSSLSNSFEGGSDGTTVTTGNSGGSSGDAFGNVTIDSGNALTYSSSSPAHGSLGALVSTGVASGSSYVAWTSGIPGTSATVWARAYHRFPAWPSADVNVLRILSSSNAIMGSVRIKSTGKVDLLYGTGTLGATSTATIPTGASFRIEVMVAAGTTTGAMSIRLYLTSADGTTADETLSVTNINAGSANPVRMRAGVVSNLANVSTFGLDDLALSDVDWIGPVGGAAATLSPTGIASTEAFGSAALSSDVAPPGIASGETHGAAALTLTITPGGIGSDEAFGTPALSMAGTISPSGIPTGEAHGTPTITANAIIAPTGTASSETFGTPLLAVTVTPAGIGSGEAHGQPAISLGIATGGIPSAEAHGTTVLGQTITVAGIASAEALGIPALTFGGPHVTVPGRGTTELRDRGTVALLERPRPVLTGYGSEVTRR